MKNLLLAILLLNSLKPVCQTVHLRSLQHEIRWLDEYRFPPFVNTPAVNDSLLQHTGHLLSQKFGTVNFTTPPKIAYRNITAFGKPKLKSPEPPGNSNDYEASVLSFFSRATTGFEVLWIMKAEVRKNGATIYAHEIKHEILHFTDETEWFTDESFVESFENLLKELLAITPPLPYRYALGEGVDYDSLLTAKSEIWAVNKNGSILGFGRPDIGSYTTLVAEKLDTAVIRSREKASTDGSVSFSGGNLFFNQYKTIDVSKTMFCRYHLGSSTDTVEALFAISIQSREQRKTVAGQLFGDKNEGSNSQTEFFSRSVKGTITADTSMWEFMIENYDVDGTFFGGYLRHGSSEYLVNYLQHAGLSREVVIKNAAGEYFASLDFKSGSTKLYIRKDLNANAKKTMATLYGILLSVRNKS